MFSNVSTKLVFINKFSGIEPDKLVQLKNVFLKFLTNFVFTNRFSGIFPVNFLQSANVL